MAHFAELDNNNLVLRIVVISNDDVNKNGGDQSETAALAVEQIVPFSNGVKWVQCSFNGNFRGKYPGVGFTYDIEKDKFIAPKPYESWTLDINGTWQSPVAYPSITTYGDNIKFSITWDENEQKWFSRDYDHNRFEWSPETSSWLTTGE